MGKFDRGRLRILGMSVERSCHWLVSRTVLDDGGGARSRFAYARIGGPSS